MVKVKDIMKKSVITVDPNISIADVARIMTNNRIGSVVVLDGEKPIEIVTDDDIVGIIANGKDPKKMNVKDLPSEKKLITADPDEDVIKVTKKMIKTGVKRMPIVKDNKLQGIVSDKEILLVAPELLEIMSEKLKRRVENVAQTEEVISGICERCEAYSDELSNISGRWICEECRNG